jgi:signal transduction histidine kinase
MLLDFLKQLEKRAAIQPLLERFRPLFTEAKPKGVVFSEKGFPQLMAFLEKGEPSFQSVAVQAGAHWSSSAQKVLLRNAILQRGFRTPSCLWAYRQMRGNPEQIMQECVSPEMGLMQIMLLKEVEPAVAIPFLIERYVSRNEAQEELRNSARLCVLRLLDSGGTPSLIRSLQSRYPGVDFVSQWRPGIPGRKVLPSLSNKHETVDFHDVVRSVRDVKELSSFTRTLYLVSLFCVPLSEKEWSSLFLSWMDHYHFQRLGLARVVEAYNGGFLLSTDMAKQKLVRQFLYDSYSIAKQTVQQNNAQRRREARESKVRSSELDRQALELVPEGIICVDPSRMFYYMNPAAEKMLSANSVLRETLFGTGPLESAVQRYAREEVISRLGGAGDGDSRVELFGDRATMSSNGRRFEVELRGQIILLRDVTDQHLIDQEIGKLYRHELGAALDVLGVGINSARQLIEGARTAEASEVLDQVEAKRTELVTMLEERMDFIRLHSDAFQVRPTALNLNLVVDKCVNNYVEFASAKGITLRSNHLHTPGVTVRGEDSFLRRALDNLIRNAIKFSDKGTEIEVSLGTENGMAFVRVEDNGPGIPKENLGKIFQLGFTTGGTGRGLYLAQRIALAHGGKIHVKNRPGQGACFTLRLPFVAE